MVERHLHRALLIALVGLTVFGCAAPPPERPIILRRPPTDRRAARAPVPRRPAVTTPSSTAVASDPSLTADQKADLFREFDRYLAEPER